VILSGVLEVFVCVTHECTTLLLPHLHLLLWQQLWQQQPKPFEHPTGIGSTKALHSAPLLPILLPTTHHPLPGPEARSAMTRYAPSLALAIGPAQPVLLELIRSPPHGSLDLLLAMITALADHSAPPQPLVAACAAHYKVTSSVQLLDPVVISLTKDDVIKLLPQLLIQLPDQRLRLLYRRLALPHAGREAMFVPVDLLVLLHRLEFSEADWATHKQHIIMAVDRAMRTPEVFPAAVMQTVRNGGRGAEGCALCWQLDCFAIASTQLWAEL